MRELQSGHTGRSIAKVRREAIPFGKIDPTGRCFQDFSDFAQAGAAEHQARSA
jgi:hypothetical protein